MKKNKQSEIEQYLINKAWEWRRNGEFEDWDVTVKKIKGIKKKKNKIDWDEVLGLMGLNLISFVCGVIVALLLLYY